MKQLSLKISSNKSGTQNCRNYNKHRHQFLIFFPISLMSHEIYAHYKSIIISNEKQTKKQNWELKKI